MMLKPEDIIDYHKNGYISPKWQMSIKELTLLKKNINNIINNNPKIRPEQIVCPHIEGGTRGDLKNINHTWKLGVIEIKVFQILILIKGWVLTQLREVHIK